MQCFSTRLLLSSAAAPVEVGSSACSSSGVLRRAATAVFSRVPKASSFCSSSSSFLLGTSALCQSGRGYAAFAAPTPLWRSSPPSSSSSSSSSPSTASPIMGEGGSVDANEETHPDFQPRAVVTDFSPEEIEMIKKDINETVRDESVVIFIKGVPEAPMCAFSKKMVDVVECLGLEYTSFDVLAHPVVRSYVKEVSEWPTIPQLFVKGEFTGGLDIILQMAQSGDLQVLLDAKGIKHRDQKAGAAGAAAESPEPSASS